MPGDSLTKPRARRQLRAMDLVDHPQNMGAAAEEKASVADLHSESDKRGLLLVGVFKICKAIFFIGVGAGAIHLMHRNLGELVMRIIDALPIDPEGRVVSMVMDKADLIDAHDLRRIGAGAFIYSVLCVIEGTGLLMRKGWAEYFTVILTVLGLPLEVFELLHRVTWLRVGALVTNLFILAYLLWVLKKEQVAELRQRLRL